MVAGEEPGQQPHDAPAGHEHTQPADAVAEEAHVAADEVGGGMQQAVGTDRAHVGHEHAERRVEVLGQHEPASPRASATLSVRWP